MLTLVLLVGVSGCAKNHPAVGINDPHEEANRRVHNFNRSMDQFLLGPASEGYGGVIPSDIRVLISNFSRNLGELSDAYNFLLQGKLKNSGIAVMRFGVNSTAGIFGIVDVVEEFGGPDNRTDFGETLHVWGMAEGQYEELPFFGPSTSRDTIGFAVDLLVNPYTFLNFDSVRGIGILAYVVARLDDRYNYSSTVDSVLYDSADSYAQARTLYLQNRRYRLGIDAAAGGSGGDAFEDPYADPYIENYSDPYEDPYAE
ncbi:VacJ family lipoprotein [Shimia biformata]|uniref:MlaA family lipoprotein n=1 Tax=Shimia biformata TaxID=1294299 RepID=UPI003084174D